MKNLIACLTAGIVTVAGLSADASVVYPGPFVGVDVTYSDVVETSADPVNDPEPLFGAPTLVAPNALDFPTITAAFASTAPPPDTTDGSLSFLYSANSGLLTDLTISEGGDWTFAGGTPSGEFVAASLTVQVRDPDTEAVLLSASDTFFTAFTSGPAESGSWSIVLPIDLTGLATDEVLVTLDNTLTASSTGNNSSEIRKTRFTVPEPGSLALLLAGGTLLGLRRR